MSPGARAGLTIVPVVPWKGPPLPGASRSTANFFTTPFWRLNVWMFSVALNVTTTKKVVSHFGEEKCTPEKILATRMEKWPRLRLVMGLRTVNPALVLMRTASFPPAGAVSVYALHPHRTSTKISFRLCFHSFCSQWQISTEVHWLSGLRSAKNRNKIRWTWLLLLRPSRLEHSSIQPSWHYWYEYIPKTTQECTFWSCLQLTIAGAPGRVA